MRNFKIIIGSKQYFDKIVEDNTSSFDEIQSFIELVRLSDERKQRGNAFTDDDKADILIVKNDHYHGIIEAAHDRIGSLIEDVSTEDADVYVHNPSMKLHNYLKTLYQRNLISYTEDKEKYQIERKPEMFTENIDSITKRIIGQKEAINEISKTLWYLTKTKRKKPYVIMLYGDSSLGKSELVREIAANFFEGKLVEKHLSMFKNDSYAYYFFGNQPNRVSLGFDILERESNLVFLDEIDKCPEYYYSAFYTLFDNTQFQDATYQMDISGLLIILTSNYINTDEIKIKLGLPIFYRIDKFIAFQKFSKDTIYEITRNEVSAHVDESEGLLTTEEIFHSVSPLIKTTNENARTIKNKVQSVVEDLLFKQIEKRESTKE
jgi:ATP-dependent Clp protease ATP-binding subunit ClpA